MEGKVEAVLAGKKSSFFPADDREDEDTMAMSSSSSASPASTFAFLAPPLSLLRHVSCLCAGYLGLDGGLKPSVPAPAPASASSASSAAAAARQRDEVEAAASEDWVPEVRSRGFIMPPKPRSAPRESRIGAVGGVIH